MDSSSDDNLLLRVARPARLLMAALGSLLCACGSDPEPESPNEVHKIPPTVGPEGACGVAERLLDDGSCQAPGLVPGACAEGFAFDSEDGCAAILPTNACADGQMATLGETNCRDIAPCGQGAWGSIVTDAATQFVDAGYLGGQSDGTAARPHLTISDGIANAAAGAVVAIAAGSYREDLALSSQNVRLWARCPTLVELVATGVSPAAVTVSAGASGSEIHDLAIVGGADGVAVEGATGVLLSRLWIHDVTGVGVRVDSVGAGAAAAVAGSLIEGTARVGLLARGAELSVDGSVIRRVRAPSGAWGRGIIAQASGAARSSLELRGSIVSQNVETAVLIHGSDALIDGCLIEKTQSNASGLGGMGLAIINQNAPDGRAEVLLRQSVLASNRHFGIDVAGADLTIERSVVRDTLPAGINEYGWAVNVRAADQPASATLVDSMLADNQDYSLVVNASSATVDGLLVRDTLRYNPEITAAAVLVFAESAAAALAKVDMAHTIIERSATVGVLVSAGDASFRSMIVRDTAPSELGEYGFGMHVQPDLSATRGSKAKLSDVLIERNHASGLLFSGSEATLERVEVRETRTAGGFFGDGITLISRLLPTVATLRDVSVRDSERAGIASFGSRASLAATALYCNPIQLAGQPFNALEVQLDDVGGNLCGCGDESEPCRLISTDLQPPEPLAGP